MEKAEEKKLTPLSGYVFSEYGRWIFRLPNSEKEDAEIEAALIEAFADNIRLQMFGVTKDIIAMEIRHARDWDRKNLNRVGCYEKSSGKLASVVRF